MTSRDTTLGSAPCGVGGDDHPIADAVPAQSWEIGQVLADAFIGYPWTDWLVPADGHRDRLAQLHSANLTEVAIPHGSVLVASCPVTDRVVAAVAALRPDRAVPDAAWSAVASVDAAVLGERIEAASAADELVAPLRPAEPSVVVATLGVVPSHRRRGLARRLLAPVLATADDLEVPTYLETSSASNVRLYRSVGFDVVGHLRMPGQGPDVWAMRRQAAPRPGA